MTGKQAMEDAYFFIAVLSGQMYALPLNSVVEVTPAVALSKPNPDLSGDSISSKLSDLSPGTFNYHGKLLPILNLRKWLNLPDQALDASQFLLVVKCDGLMAGCLVDDVEDVCQFSQLQNSEQSWLPSGDGKITVLTLATRVLFMINENLLASDIKRLDLFLHAEQVPSL